MTRNTLPQHGTVWKELEEELMALKAGDIRWRKGIFFTNWPQPGGNIHLVAKEASNLFYNQLIVGRRMQPSAQKLASDLRDFTLSLFNAPDGALCTLTAGGTESNFHSVKVARDRARSLRPAVTDPALVVPDTAHPSFEKAGRYLGVRIVRVPVRADYRADTKAMAAAITPDTIGLVGSSPNYPYGICDEIEAIAALAQERALWCHVDACVGGFLIPTLHRLGHKVPAFDFSVSGVNSISADLHKFGYCPTGISTFSLRDSADMEFQAFRSNVWASGEYVTHTLAGSSSAAPIAAAWAVMRSLGTEGYLEIARGILATIEKLRGGIEKAGLRVLVEPEAGILVYTSESIDIRVFAGHLKDHGYPSSFTLKPLSIHLLVDPMEDPRQYDDYVTAVAASADAARRGEKPKDYQEVAYA